MQAGLAQGPTLPRVVRRAVQVTAACAVVLCGILLLHTHRQGMALPGCGVTSGCDAVAASGWSRVMGVPVALPALLVYGALLIASLSLDRRLSDPARRRALEVMWFCAAAAGAAAVYFLLLQAVVVRAFCVYCTATHAVGLAIFGIMVWSLLAGRPRMRWTGGATWAVVGVAALGGLQWTVPVQQAYVRSVSVLDAAADFEPVGGGRVSLLGGRAVLSLHGNPLLGPRDADVVVGKLFDYTCPHCRRLHPHLRAARARYGGRLAVMPLVLPINAACNRLVSRTPPGHESACELASLALAVFRADPNEFEPFHEWLMTGAQPPAVSTARAAAAARVGEAALQEALRSGWAREHVRRNEAFIPMTDGHLPQILGPASIISGRPRDVEELCSLLEAGTLLGERASGGEAAEQ